jgi:proteasome lid subunit RPN8/RPN11
LEFGIRESALEAIIAHARSARPNECCGVLIGGEGRIEEAVAGRNIADRPTRYLLDPQDHINALRGARRRGLQVVGFYHSHPHSAPVPSETDRAEASYPDHLYLIVGFATVQPEVRLFKLVSGNFLELTFVTVA